MQRRHVRLGIGLAIGAALVLGGCSGSSSSPPTTTPGALQALAPSAAAPSRAGLSAPTKVGGGGQSATIGETAVTIAPLIVRSGSVTLGVPKDDVVSSFNKVSSIALTLGGFVSSSATGVGSSGASLVVRVPTEEFASLTKQVSSIGHVRSETVTGHDVTGESINLEARITNLDSEQNALRALMARTGSIPNILEVQNELFSVESEIEQLTADESSLLNKATYATLSVSIQPFSSHAKPVVKPRTDAVKRAFNLAGHNTVVGLRDIALAVGWTFPLLVLASIAGALLWVRRRLVRRRTPAASPNPAG
ncbi:MAG: DUF4349 domain-containing protein [Acidimicrobiales bacterium]